MAYLNRTSESRFMRQASRVTTPFDVTSPTVPSLRSTSAACGCFLGMAVILHRAPARTPDTMHAATLNTPTLERLCELPARLRQLATLIEESLPPVVLGRDSRQLFPVQSSERASAQPCPASGNGSSHPPIADTDTFCARWCGKTCHLGDTMAFRVLKRLAHRPNVFVSCTSLLEDLWQPHTSFDAVRSAVKVLRRKLRDAGMEDMADAIDGSTARHYRLRLN